MILLTDGQQRKTLAAARSLGMKGIEVLVSEKSRVHPSGFSRFCRRSLICPDPAGEPQKYFEWLLESISKYKCEVLFPMDDSTMEVVMEHRKEIEKLCALPIPPYDSYMKTRDKGNSTALAISAGVDCPKTFMPDNTDALYEIAQKIRYPAVIKPRISAGSRGIRKAFSMEEMIREYKQAESLYEKPIIQEYIGSGDRYDVCLLYDMEGNLKASFIQKELRHFPVEMGPSTVQESVHYPELIESSLAIMGKLPWRGVVELEYMIDENDGRPKFMEINPRFWASLQTSISSGIDFPWMLYNIALNKPLEGVYEYPEGVRCRWMFPGDILHFITNSRRLRMDPSFFSRIKDDIAWIKDPMPVIGFMLACFRYLFDKKMWKAMFDR